MFALHLTTKLLAERWLSLTVNLIFLKNSSSEADKSSHNHLYDVSSWPSLSEKISRSSTFSPGTLFPLIKNCKSAAGFERSDQHSTMASWPLDITVLDTLILGLPFSG